MQVTTIGLDLAKNILQVHGVDTVGRGALKRRLRRGEVLEFFASLPPCLVGLEACAGAHWWAREIGALGHEVRIMPAHYVRAYVKRNKNDAADAEAICEAVTRPSMRFVPIKGAEQQSVLLLHRTRELLVRQRTMLVNALRGHLGEFGIVVPQGARNVAKLFAIIADVEDRRVPPLAKEVLRLLVEQLRTIESKLAELERDLLAWHRANEVSQRLATVPGIGPITATAITAAVGDPTYFRSARHFAAWLGLVPRQHSSGGKERLGRISKRGDSYLRKLLIHGARTVMRWRRRGVGLAASPWLAGLLERRPVNVTTVALANKNARIVWAMMMRGESFRRPAAATAA
jgi:transposase